MTAVPTRPHRSRVTLAAASVAGALVLLAGPTARAADHAVEEPDRCQQLAEQLEFLPAEWPAAQVMRASLDRCLAAA